MNTDRILIYGERLGDLEDALAQEPASPGEMTRDQLAVASPLLRALERAYAEVLLEEADRGGLVFLDTPAPDRRAEAAHRVVLEMVQVAAEPLVLHSHPALAAAGRRASENV